MPIIVLYACKEGVIKQAYTLPKCDYNAHMCFARTSYMLRAPNFNFSLIIYLLTTYLSDRCFIQTLPKLKIYSQTYVFCVLGDVCCGLPMSTYLLSWPLILGFPLDAFCFVILYIQSDSKSVLQNHYSKLCFHFHMILYLCAYFCPNFLSIRTLGIFYRSPCFSSMTSS